MVRSLHRFPVWLDHTYAWHVVCFRSAVLLMCCVTAVTVVHAQKFPPVLDAAGQTPRRSAEAQPGVDLYGDPVPDGVIARLGTVRYRRLSGIHFLADGQTVIGTRGSKLAWIDVSSGRTVRELSLAEYTWEEASTLLALSQDRSLAAVLNRRMLGNDDEYTITVVDTQMGNARSQLQWKRSESETPQAACFTPDNLRLLTCSRVLRVWDLDSQSVEETLELPVDGANEAMALSPDGTLLALRAGRGAHLWNWQTGEHFELPGPLARGIDGVAFTPDGTKLATMSDELNGVRVWDVATRRLLWRGNSGVGNSSYGSRIEFSSDGQLLAAPAGPPASVQLWDVATGNLTATLDTAKLKPREVAISPDDRWLMVAGHPGFAGAAFQVWDLATRQRLGEEFFGHQQAPTDIRFAPDGEQIVTAARDGIVGIWDAESGQLMQRIGHEADSMVSALAISPDGQLIASGGHDNLVVIWDRKTGERVFNLVGHGRLGGDGALQFTPDGERLLSFGDDWFLRAFDVATGKAVLEHAIRLEDVPLKEAEDGSVALEGSDFSFFRLLPNELFTPDGSRLVMGVSNTLYVIDVESGNEIAAFAAESSDRMAISPDSRWVASVIRGPSFDTPLVGGGVRSSASREQGVIIHSLETGEVVHEFRLPDGHARGLAFSPDGEKLAVIQVSIHVYEVESGREQARFEADSPAAWAVAFSQDGERLAASHYDGTVLVWEWRRFAIDSPGESD